MNEPVYISTVNSGRVEKKIQQAFDIIKACVLCPRKCGVNRLSGQTGICKTGDSAYVAGYHPHFGEESSLSGRHGSGTIFFTHCNLLCNFCQNYDVSHQGNGDRVSDKQIAQRY